MKKHNKQNRYYQNLHETYYYYYYYFIIFNFNNI